MMCRYLVIGKHMIVVSMKQWSTLENQALGLISINACTLCNFFGNLYTQGVKPSLYNEEAMKQVQAPINKQQLTLFLGMVTYLSSYMPNISDLTLDFRGLLKKDVLFKWTEAYDIAFQNIKNETGQDVCLRYFNTIKYELQVDASQIGLGSVLP